MPKCQCAGNACNCNLVAGDGLTIQGTGNASAPFTISLSSPLITVDVTAPGPIDASAATSGAVVVLNLSANVTSLTLPTTPGTRIDVIIVHTLANTTVTWPTIKWPGGTPPVQSTTAGRVDWISLRLYGPAWIGAPLALNAS